MSVSEECNRFNHLLNQLVAYQEGFTAGDYLIQPQVLHFTYPISPKEQNNWHAHRSYECSVLLDGKMRYYIGDKDVVVEVGGGDAIAIPANTRHHWEIVEEPTVLGLMLHVSCTGAGAQRRMAALNHALTHSGFRLRNFQDGGTTARLLQLLRKPQGFMDCTLIAGMV